MFKRPVPVLLFILDETKLKIFTSCYISVVYMLAVFEFYLKNIFLGILYYSANRGCKYSVGATLIILAKNCF